jgi:hypothetical protein
MASKTKQEPSGSALTVCTCISTVSASPVVRLVHVACNCIAVSFTVISCRYQSNCCYISYASNVQCTMSVMAVYKASGL